MRERFQFESFISRVERDPFWINYADSLARGEIHATFHVAVFSEPFLSYVLEGKKTIESRFSQVRCAPFRDVEAGDVILIKAAGGPVCAVSQAVDIVYYDYARGSINEIRKRYGNGICADDEFWEAQENAQYATIIELSNTIIIDPLEVMKRDRRGWMTICTRQGTFAF